MALSHLASIDGLLVRGGSTRQASTGVVVTDGLDHARDMTEDLVFDGFDAFNTAMFSATHCTTGWISTQSTAAGVPVPLTANGFMMADYTADLCSGTCGQPPPGFDAERYFAYTLDIVSTGAMPDATADAQLGAFLFRVEQAEGGGCR